MKTFKQYIRESEERTTMTRLALYNNLLLRKSAFGKDKVITKRIMEFFVNVIRYIKDLVDTNIKFNIYAEKIFDGDTVISIEVKNQDKQIDVILNKDLFNNLFKDSGLIDVSETNIFKIKNDIPSIKKAIELLNAHLKESIS